MDVKISKVLQKSTSLKPCAQPKDIDRMRDGYI